MNLVMTLKDTYIQFRIREDVKNSLQKVAEMRGLTMSAFENRIEKCSQERY